MSTSKRGFASMDRAKQLECARKGGKAAHNPAPGKSKGHEFKKGSKLARDAGRKGGAISRGGRGRLRPDQQRELDSAAQLDLRIDVNNPQEA